MMFSFPLKWFSNFHTYTQKDMGMEMDTVFFVSITNREFRSFSASISALTFHYTNHRESALENRTRGSTQVFLKLNMLTGNIHALWNVFKFHISLVEHTIIQYVWKFISIESKVQQRCEWQTNVEPHWSDIKYGYRTIKILQKCSALVDFNVHWARGSW